MGQPIEVSQAIVLGDMLVLDTDRSITGQDGFGFARGDDLDESGPGLLAGRIFEADQAIDHVFAASAQVVTRRAGGWDDDAVAAITAEVASFFVFYDG